MILRKCKDSSCSCGSRNEYIRHFVKFPNYATIKQALATNYSNQLILVVARLPSILFGKMNLTATENMKLYKDTYIFHLVNKRSNI